MTDPINRDPAELWAAIDWRDKAFAVRSSEGNALELLRVHGMENNGRAVCYVPKAELDRVKAELEETKRQLMLTEAALTGAFV